MGNLSKIWGTPHSDASEEGFMNNMEKGLGLKSETVLVRQVRGLSGRTKEVIRTVDALGLRGIGSSREIRLNTSTRGMIRRVHQLVLVEPLG